MALFKRSDGQFAEAVQFKGYVEMGAEGVFQITTWLNMNDVPASWRPEESTGTWDENEKGEIYEVMVPERIELGVNEWKDEAGIGDYIVRRDGDFYAMRKDLFESAYEPITAEAFEIEKLIPKCTNCNRPITNVGDDGKVYKTFKHADGPQKGLIRCWPDDTGQPYGLDATPNNG